MTVVRELPLCSKAEESLGAVGYGVSRSSAAQIHVFLVYRLTGVDALGLSGYEKIGRWIRTHRAGDCSSGVRHSELVKVALSRRRCKHQRVCSAMICPLSLTVGVFVFAENGSWELPDVCL